MSKECVAKKAPNGVETLKLQGEKKLSRPAPLWRVEPITLDNFVHHFNVLCGDDLVYEGATSESQINRLVALHNSTLGGGAHAEQSSENQQRVPSVSGVLTGERISPAHCPYCPDQGWYVVPNRNTGEPVQEQCEWQAALLSSETIEWATPQWLFDALNKEFGFTVDVCATHENAKCEKHYTRHENGLLKSWAGEVAWMNPPYGDEIEAWMAKAFGAALEDGATVVCLVPSRTDTAWWHRYAMKHEIRFLRGRLKFGNAEDSAPFPSAAVVMRPLSFKLVGLPVETSGESK
jgi:phage N-6-adenine-methyltransferase